MLSARRQRVDLVSAHTIARVSLLLALGGSFDPAAPVPTEAPAEMPAQTASSNP